MTILVSWFQEFQDIVSNVIKFSIVKKPER